MLTWECSHMWREARFIAFSQNSIANPRLIKRLITKSDLSFSDKVLEIGAGSGVITKQLSKVCGQVLAVEIDKKFFKKLHKVIDNRKVELINSNILVVPLPVGEYKVFSNIPFNFTSRIMNKLYFQGNPPQSAYIIMQKEAGNIYLGWPRETQKSLLLKPFFSFEVAYRFKPTDFKPVPKVSSIMLKITKLATPLIAESDKPSYFDFVVYGTTRHKETLVKSLAKVFTYKQIKRLSQDLEFSMNAKSLDLSCLQWVSLFKFYNQNVLDEKKRTVNGEYSRQKFRQKSIKKRYRTRQIKAQ